MPSKDVKSEIAAQTKLLADLGRNTMDSAREIFVTTRDAITGLIDTLADVAPGISIEGVTELQRYKSQIDNNLTELEAKLRIYDTGTAAAPAGDPSLPPNGHP